MSETYSTIFEIPDGDTVIEETGVPVAAVHSATSVSTGTLTANRNQLLPIPAMCRYYLRGTCRYGTFCRFLHDCSAWVNIRTIRGANSAMMGEQHNPSTGRIGTQLVKKTWAQIVAGSVTENEADTAASDYETEGKKSLVSMMKSFTMMVCPCKGPCPRGASCFYTLHFELCQLCKKYCLHPIDQVQRRKHNDECKLQYEQAMQLSAAKARSQDKICGICFDNIMEKRDRERRFGILPNCKHVYCLKCIRKWRKSKEFEQKIRLSCPECRIISDFVCPSAFWVEAKMDKDRLIAEYRAALGKKDCKYFKKGKGRCPFGNKCFYKHTLANGDSVDVGSPERGSYLRNRRSELVDILWDYVVRRNYNWLDSSESDTDNPSHNSDSSEDI